MASEDSSTKPVTLATECECGHTRNFHTPWGHRMHPCTECTCGNFRVRQEPKPDLRCTCGCLRSQHMGKPHGCLKHGFHAFVCDHSRCGWKPRQEPHNFSSPSHCAECAKTWIQCPRACREGHTYSGSCAHRADGPKGREHKHCMTHPKGWPHTDGQCCTCGAIREEPPMTPEEEEEAPCPHESWEVTSHWKAKADGGWWKSRRCADCREPLDNIREDEPHDFSGPEGDVDPDHVCETYFCPASGEDESACHGGFDVCCDAPENHMPAGQAPTPPQPERRPPYAVDYSAGGHAFQVLVPGDAAVLAVDGALIIRHADFPVLGISCITPLKMEAS